MSTEVSMKDESALQAAIAEVLNDTTETNYIICGHVDGNPGVIELRTTGYDTMEIASHMNDVEALYCLARYETDVDMSTVVKFVYIHWLGEKVPMVKKGRLGVVHGSVMEKFPRHHLFIETSSTEDLEKEKIIEQLKESMGTKNKVLEKAEVSNRQMRGFTQTQLPQKKDKPNFSVSAVASRGLAVEILPEVYDTVAQVRSDTDPQTWVLVGYKDSNPKGPMITIGSGVGDLSELQDCMDQSSAMYGLYRVSHTNADDIPTVKFVYIIWVGSLVKPMFKAKISTHRGAVEEIFSPFHVAVFASEPSEISERNIMDKIKQQAS